MPRERDLVFEAICEAVRWDWHDLTSTERARVNQAAKVLRDKDPAEIKKRGEEAWRRYGKVGVTPQTLMGNWTVLGQDLADDAEPARRPFQRRRMVVD